MLLWLNLSSMAINQTICSFSHLRASIKIEQVSYLDALVLAMCTLHWGQVLSSDQTRYSTSSRGRWWSLSSLPCVGSMARRCSCRPLSECSNIRRAVPTTMQSICKSLWMVRRCLLVADRSTYHACEAQVRWEQMYNLQSRTLTRSGIDEWRIRRNMVPAILALFTS